MSPRSSSQRSRRSSAPAELDVYVTLLFVSVISLIAGCAFLAVEISTYGLGTPGL